MPGYQYIARDIDENSLLLDDPGVLLTVFRAVEESRHEKLRLHGLSRELKLLVSRPELVRGTYLLSLQGSRFDAWLLVYRGVIVAARLDEAGFDTTYGLQALRFLEEWTGLAEASYIRLREKLYERSQSSRST